MTKVPGNLQELQQEIRAQQSSFSPAQRQVAAYVVENSYRIPFLSITQLSQTIGVSESTVIKFCNRLGFPKFGDFKKALSGYAHGELVMSNKLSQAPESQENDPFTIGLEEDTAAIAATLNNPTNRQALADLLEQIKKAEHIYITAGRASYYMAGIFASALQYLGLRVHELSFGIGDYWDRLALITEKDLVIALSLPRYTAQIVDGLSYLHSKGIPIALITDTGLSPAQPYADVTFYCTVSSNWYFPCYSGCVALISAICRAVGAQRKAAAADHITALERRLIDAGMFK